MKSYTVQRIDLTQDEIDMLVNNASPSSEHVGCLSISFVTDTVSDWRCPSAGGRRSFRPDPHFSAVNAWSHEWWTAWIIRRFSIGRFRTRPRYFSLHGS